jgi:type IV secretion system protein VirB10
MSADALSPLPGEPTLPPLVPPASSSHLKTFAAAAGLLLSLVAVLGFAASRYMGSKKDAAAEAPVEVASAAAPRVTFKEPVSLAAPPPAALPAAPPDAASQVTTPPPQVPGIEVDGMVPVGAQAIPLRGGATAGGVQRARVVPGDESPFTAGAVGVAGTSQTAGDVGPAAAGGPTGPIGTDAQANLKRYQTQLGGMLAQLQGLADRAGGGAGSSTGSSTGPGAASTLAAALSLPTTAAATNSAVGGATSPALFGSLERSSTPSVVANLMGNRSLTLPKGVLFTCSLKTRVISATSGFVACQVQRNVFSDDGKVVLAERGSHLDGEYRIVQVRPGVTRIPVLWTRLRTPNGITVDLDSPGTGQLGESGIGGYVDNRWPERLGAALLVSLIDDAVKLVVNDGEGNGSNTGNTTVLLPSTTAAGSKLAEKVLDATINIPPLLYQNQGSVVGVYVARDVDFSRVYALEPR